jgi:hypothetical protein
MIEDRFARRVHHAVPPPAFMLIAEWLTIVPLDGVLALRGINLHQHAAVYPK